MKAVDLEVCIRKVSTVAEVDARTTGPLESRAFLRSVLAGSAALAAAAEVNLNAVAVNLYVGDGDPLVAGNADTLVLEKLGQVLKVEAAVIEALVGFGVYIDVDTILIRRHVEEGLHVLAQ